VPCETCAEPQEAYSAARRIFVDNILVQPVHGATRSSALLQHKSRALGPRLSEAADFRRGKRVVALEENDNGSASCLINKKALECVTGYAITAARLGPPHRPLRVLPSQENPARSDPKEARHCIMYPRGRGTPKLLALLNAERPKTKGRPIMPT